MLCPDGKDTSSHACRHGVNHTAENSQSASFPRIATESRRGILVDKHGRSTSRIVRTRDGNECLRHHQHDKEQISPHDACLHILSAAAQHTGDTAQGDNGQGKDDRIQIDAWNKAESIPAPPSRIDTVRVGTWHHKHRSAVPSQGYHMRRNRPHVRIARRRDACRMKASARKVRDRHDLVASKLQGCAADRDHLDSVERIAPFQSPQF
jgi:hypothetical protein